MSRASRTSWTAWWRWNRLHRCKASFSWALPTFRFCPMQPSKAFAACSRAMGQNMHYHCLPNLRRQQLASCWVPLHRDLTVAVPLNKLLHSRKCLTHLLACMRQPANDTIAAASQSLAVMRQAAIWEGTRLINTVDCCYACCMRENKQSTRRLK